ncbi:radical SAM protein [Patescibacteria group bacterium]|nr:radical SAM protein [Patescibacteria group bacterium]MBU4600542.1 radical SAM protein [Patescibacteria group bacterium]MCG2697788.1 radical SAM protein [Candidatus Parcubacteria bacterium]
MKKIQAPSVPHLVHIETTYACNSNCIFCYNPLRGIPFNKDKIDSIVKSIYELWIPHVYLIGGEPSLLGVRRLNEYIDFLSERSSVTIVTNGVITLKGLSDRLACIGVPIHGNEATHERHTQNRGSYSKAMQSIKQYVDCGFDVRCIPVLTAWNFDQMYDVICLAKDLGMESVFVDRFEDGGLGSRHSSELKPSLNMFKTALGQMIKARDDFKISVGFGTAIPYCLDERLITENMFANCGAGVTFAAVRPNGDVRLCNQSEIVYGNILNESIEKIWAKKHLEEFRNLSWVTDPCRSCPVLYECVCGCKVDSNCSSGYCVDYAVREMKTPIYPAPKLPCDNSFFSFPKEYRQLRVDRFTKINTHHPESYLVTRYQTINIDETAVDVARKLIQMGQCDEKDLVSVFADMVEEEEIRLFVTKMIAIQALHQD